MVSNSCTSCLVRFNTACCAYIYISFQGREYLTVASMDSALSHSLVSEDSDNDLLER